MTAFASAPAVAQADLQAIDRRMSQFSARGNYAAALVEAKKLEAAAKARYGVDHETYATVLNNVAFLHATLGQYDEAEDIFKRVLALREKNAGPDDLQVAKTLDMLSQMYATRAGSRRPSR